MIIRRGEKKRRQKNRFNRKRPSLGYVLKKLLFWVVFLGFWGTSLWTIFLSGVMKVEVVAVESSRARKTDIENIVRASISGNYLSVIPKDNLLLVPKKKIRRAIEEDFIFVRTVDVARTFPSTINVNVKERESHIIWCNGGKCLLVDEQAEAFFELGNQEKNLEENLVQVKDLSGKEVELGMRVAKPSFILFCEDLPDKLSLLASIQVDRDMETPSSMSDEVRARTQEGWILMLSTQRSIETQSEILKKIIKEKITPEKIQQLEYIDLRVKGKATYKFQESEEESHDDGPSEEEQKDQ